MKKTLYSLMLSDDVVREIDDLAHRMGTSRSNLVNMILAERVQLRTPEQQISDVFDGIEQLLAGSRELIPLITPNTPSMALRSSLEYKYRPTVRYEVELSNGFIPGEPIGTLTASFRTQSQGLLELIGRFFRCLQAHREQAASDRRVLFARSGAVRQDARLSDACRRRGALEGGDEPGGDIRGYHRLRETD